MNIRLFAAITLPDEINDELEVFASGLPGARWSPAERRHLTVRFIGEVDGLVYQDVVAALEQVHVPRFDIALRGVGHFPPRGAPKSLWAGVEDAQGAWPARDRLESKSDMKRHLRYLASLKLLRTVPGEPFRYALNRNAYVRRELEDDVDAPTEDPKQ